METTILSPAANKQTSRNQFSKSELKIGGPMDKVVSSQEFRSNDFYLSAFLHARGCVYLGVEKNAAGDHDFIFKRDASGTLSSLVEEYFDNGLISASKYRNSILFLRGQLKQKNS